MTIVANFTQIFDDDADAFLLHTYVCTSMHGRVDVRKKERKKGERRKLVSNQFALQHNVGLILYILQFRDDSERKESRLCRSLDLKIFDVL